jgi:hypothetical protein
MTPGKRYLGFLIAGSVLLGGCGEQGETFRLLEPAHPFDHEIAMELVEVFESNSRHRIELVPVPAEFAMPLEALEAGFADLALTSNAQPYRKGITTVMPLYPTVLHILHLRERTAESPGELFRGATVNAGPVGSASRQLMTELLDSLNMQEEDVSFSAGGDPLTDVVVLYLPILPGRVTAALREYGAAGAYRFVSFGLPRDIGTGSAIDRALLLNPRLSPFVIPVGTYDDIPEEPVVTLAVDKLLVSRPELESAAAYDLISEIRRLQPALAATYPMLFQHINEEFDPSGSTFVLHPGAQAFSERHTPTFYERYSGVAEVLVTLVIGLVSGTYAVIQIYNRKRKNRIDGFYSDVMKIRDSINEHSSAADRAAAVEKVQALQNSAFEMLISEKLAADESFRIFVTLSNDIIAQLK